MKNPVLTDRRLEWYFEIEVPKMNLENQIHQPFHTPAAGKNLKPYQGLKLINELASVIGIPLAGKNLKPYQGLKPNSCN